MSVQVVSRGLRYRVALNSIMGLVALTVSIGSYLHIQSQRKERVEDSAESDRLICERQNRVYRLLGDNGRPGAIRVVSDVFSEVSDLPGIDPVTKVVLDDAVRDLRRPLKGLHTVDCRRLASGRKFEP